MNKRKIILIITICVVCIILIASCILAYLKSVENKKLKEGNLKVVIYQYHLDIDKLQENGIIYKSFVINNNTVFDEVVYALDNEKEYNFIRIKNGVITVTESNCPNHNCMNTIIDINNKDFSLLNPNTTTIECRPHGLKIILEEAK